MSISIDWGAFKANQRSILVEWMTIYTETHNCPKCREQVSVECLVINETSVLQLLLQKLRKHSGRQGKMTVRASGQEGLTQNSLFWTQQGWWTPSSRGCLHKTYIGTTQSIFQLGWKRSTWASIPNWGYDSEWLLGMDRQCSLGMWSG